MVVLVHLRQVIWQVGNGYKKAKKQKSKKRKEDLKIVVDYKYNTFNDRES
jgi:hypothetical protein